MNETHFTESDRKLLTLLEDRQRSMAEVIEKIQAKLDSDVFVKKVDAEERYKEFSSRFEDHENRMRWMERIAYGGLAILTFVDFVLKYTR